MNNRLTHILAAIVALALRSAHARDVIIPPTGDWAAAVNALKPGDVALLQQGRYKYGPTITVRGTESAPVIIRGQGRRESAIDGRGKSGTALTLRACTNLVIENVLITNPSRYGIDGTTTWDHMKNKKKYPKKKGLNEGLVVRDCARVTIRHCRFDDIGTRGILAGNTDRLRIEQNLFFKIGNDTASGDVALGGRTRRWTIRGNLFAGNVDGVVCDGAGAEGLIERNLFVFHKWEDAIDLKVVYKKKDEDPWNTIRYNIIYADQTHFSGITLQDGTQCVRVYYNVIHGMTGTKRKPGAGRGLMLQSRARRIGKDVCKDYFIVGNWFDAFDHPGEGTAIVSFRNSKKPAPLQNVWILHNVISGFKHAVELRYGDNVNVFNNIFADCSPHVKIKAKAAGNLYRNTEPWDADSAPITEDPTRGAAPAPGKPEAAGPGNGKAAAVDGLDWDCGRDVGIPKTIRIDGQTYTFEDWDSLEASIFRKLAGHFSHDELKKCLAIGRRPIP